MGQAVATKESKGSQAHENEQLVHRFGKASALSW
jgi:hypothetical protein